jgi:hypothetical protein
MFGWLKGCIRIVASRDRIVCNLLDAFVRLALVKRAVSALAKPVAH